MELKLRGSTDHIDPFEIAVPVPSRATGRRDKARDDRHLELALGPVCETKVTECQILAARPATSIGIFALIVENCSAFRRGGAGRRMEHEKVEVRSEEHTSELQYLMSL